MYLENSISFREAMDFLWIISVYAPFLLPKIRNIKKTVVNSWIALLKFTLDYPPQVFFSSYLSVHDILPYSNFVNRYVDNYADGIKYGIWHILGVITAGLYSSG